MLFTKSLVSLIIFFVSVFSQGAQGASGEDSAAIIANYCSNAIALIHTSLDAAISLALQTRENATQYIPSITKDLMEINQALDNAGQNLLGSRKIKDPDSAAKTATWTGSLSETYVDSLSRIIQLSTNDLKDWKELVTPLQLAHKSAERFYHQAVTFNPDNPTIQDQQYKLDVGFHNAEMALWGSG